MIRARQPRGGDLCHACEYQHNAERGDAPEPTLATCVLEGETSVGSRALQLCDAHAIRIWQALSFVLMSPSFLDGGPVLKLRGPNAVEPNARGKKLL